MTQRQIRFGIIHYSPATVQFRIIMQTHRGTNFNPPTVDFIASNGVRICSSSRPEVFTDVLYLQGTNILGDNIILQASPGTFVRFVCAISEYNAKFADGQPYDPGKDVVWLNSELDHS